MYYNGIDDEDVISVQVITPSKSEHETNIVSNVVYGGKRTKANARKDEKFYQWIKSLNPDLNKDVKTETNSFEYRKYTVDGKTKTNE